jgi:hypothetical protein
MEVYRTSKPMESERVKFLNAVTQLIVDHSDLTEKFLHLFYDNQDRVTEMAERMYSVMDTILPKETSTNEDAILLSILLMYTGTDGLCCVIEEFNRLKRG